MNGVRAFPFHMHLLTVFLFMIIITLQFTVKGHAASNLFVHGESYEMEDGSSFDLSAGNHKDVMSYGSSSMGKLSLSGALKEQAVFNGVQAYGIDGDITFSYSYNRVEPEEDDKWHLVSSDERAVASIDLPKKVGNGSIIVQRSENGDDWEIVHTLNDIFTKNVDRLSETYTVSSDDAKVGYYYRVLIAYRMGRRIGSENLFWHIPNPRPEMEYTECMEIYNFYVFYNSNPVRMRALETGADITGATTVKNGFIIDKGGSDYTVAVKRNGGTVTTAEDQSTFSEPGKYTVLITTDLGKQYQSTITVTDGLKMTSVSPVVYENRKGDNYTCEHSISGKTNFGLSALTSLKIAQQANSTFTVGSLHDFKAYGLTGNQIGIYLRLNDFSEAERDGWIIESDTWGKKESQTISDAWVGAVGTGALLIQKSVNGQTWENVEAGAYAKGLCTTDYYSNYANRGDVLIYTPDGKEFLHGLYLRVVYAYEVSQGSSKTAERCMEVYEMYLCSNNLDAVTFHNLSVNDSIKETLATDDPVDYEMYQKAETLVSGSGTATGFEIDTSLNPTVQYTVLKDGVEVPNRNSSVFSASGKYDITLKSVVGTQKTVTIYVDPQDAEGALEHYFGDCFLTGKRIYSEGEYPVYEGGQTVYHVKANDKLFLPVTGTIENTTMHKTISVQAGTSDIRETLKEPGSYTATFTTRPTGSDGDLPGDYRVFTFRFEIIPEGSAPGPVVNQKSLKEYAASNVSDAYPIYYGLTYQSASKGNITLAFATKEAAKEYAYNYEKGMVEQQADGTYRYLGSFYVAQKEKYESAWDLTDAMYYFAEQAVQPLAFDLSDPFTYLTLSDEIIEKTANLRTLELDRSVTIFADGQKEQMCDTDMPVISRKPCAYLTPGTAGTVDNGYLDFEFIKDKYGCDSDSVVIIDAEGKEHDIEYHRGVGEQLTEQKCPSGIVTIKESTVYGDTAEYQAVFIANGENTAELSLLYYEGGKELSRTFTQMDDGAEITVDAFRISDVQDALDPYCLITIEEGSEQQRFAADQIEAEAWSEPGEYTVTVTNRLGSSYAIHVRVEDSGYATLAFSGAGTENLNTIITSFGAEHVTLPALTRYGYDFDGYTDADGNVYTDEISSIVFKGTRVLEPIWKAKHTTLYFHDMQGREVDAPLTVEFGKKYELPSPEIQDGYTFLGWSQDGEIVTADKLTVDTEEDIYLVAEVGPAAGNHAAAASDNSVTEASSVDSNRQSHRKWPVVVVIVALVSAALLIKSKIGKKQNKVEDQPGIDEDDTVLDREGDDPE